MVRISQRVFCHNITLRLERDRTSNLLYPEATSVSDHSKPMNIKNVSLCSGSTLGGSCVPWDMAGECGPYRMVSLVVNT